MTNSESQAPGTPEPSAEDQRHELQGLLGEYHGLLTTMVDRFRGLAEPDELAALYTDIEEAFPDVSISFGQVQGELNTGKHDPGLDQVGLSGDQLKPKRRGFRYNCKRFYSAIVNVPPTPTSQQERNNLMRAAKHAIRGVKWGNIIMGSLLGELGKFRGAEVIREFGEVVVTGLEQIIEGAEASSADRAE